MVEAIHHEEQSNRNNDDLLGQKRRIAPNGRYVGEISEQNTKGTVHFTLYWTGGTAVCFNCTQAGGTPYNGSFACNNDGEGKRIGNWDNGEKVDS